MRTIKSVGRVIRTQEFKPKSKEDMMFDILKANKGNGYYRKGNFSTELVWDKKSYIFPSENKQYKSYRNGMFLFGMVRKDAKQFIKSGRKIKLPKVRPSNEYNDNFDKFAFKMTGTDLNHAYWRIAYNLGIISENTYEKGLHEDLKTVRLSALSTLGKGKEYFVIKDGVVTNEVVRIGNDDDMDNLYKAIRYTCFKYMQKVKKMLGQDFICYRTDCVYYVDTPENRKMVRDYFKAEQMSMKQLYAIKKTPHE
jgi:hypothetical protein